MMRIISGKHRSRKLAVPETADIRPTSDRAREALFSMLQHRLGTFESVVVLDAFCGSGAQGLEALSRGAEQVFQMDSAKAALDLARKNAATLGETAHCVFLQADAAHPPSAPKPCHLLLLDPPYHKDLAEKSLQALTEKGWAAPAALACVETARDEEFAPPDGWNLVAERVHGAAKLWLLER